MYTYEHEENYEENICRDFKMILKVFLRRKILGGLSVEYLGSISGKNLRGITGEIFVGYFEEEFGENIDHYILFVEINSQTNIF
jgi:hypothetical protein